MKGQESIARGLGLVQSSAKQPVQHIETVAILQECLLGKSGRLESTGARERRNSIFERDPEYLLVAASTSLADSMDTSYPLSATLDTSRDAPLKSRGITMLSSNGKTTSSSSMENGESSVPVLHAGAAPVMMQSALAPAIMDSSLLQSLQAGGLPTMMPSTAASLAAAAAAVPAVSAEAQQQQQLLWQQAFQQLASSNLAAAAATQPGFGQVSVPGQLQQPPPPQAVTQTAQPFLLPNQQAVGVAATTTASLPQMPAMPMHFFSALQAGQVQIQQAVPAVAMAPMNPAQPIHDYAGMKRHAHAPEAAAKPRAKKSKVEPLVVPSYSHEPSSVMSVHSDDGSDVFKDTMTPADYEKMTPAQRRRHERNLREQQRSYRISNQIKNLRTVLSESNIPFKPNKFSILVAIVEYIKQLQSRSIMLDSEHQKLIDTLRECNELVSSGQVPDDPSSSGGVEPSKNESADMMLVQGLDYSAVVDRCPYAIGVAALDGRVLSCNDAFEKLLGCSRDEMQQQSLFMLIRNHQELFEAMACLLKKSSAASEAGECTTDAEAESLFYWCGNIESLRGQQVSYYPTVSYRITVDQHH